MLKVDQASASKKVHAMPKCFKCAFCLLARSGRLLFLKKDFQFDVIVWENNPTPLLIYDLGKQFPNEKMNEIFIL